MLKEMGIALQLYSVREDMEKDLPGTLARRQSHGLRGRGNLRVCMVMSLPRCAPCWRKSG